MYTMYRQRETRRKAGTGVREEGRLATLQSVSLPLFLMKAPDSTPFLRAEFRKRNLSAVSLSFFLRAGRDEPWRSSRVRMAARAWSWYLLMERVALGMGRSLDGVEGGMLWCQWDVRQ